MSGVGDACREGSAREAVAGVASRRGASPRDVATVLVAPHGLLAEGLQATLGPSRFRVATRLEDPGDLAAIVADLPSRFLLIVDGSRTPTPELDPAGLERLREARPGVVVALIARGPLASVDRALFEAADVTIDRDASPEQLVGLLSAAMDGTAILPARFAGATRRAALPAPLAPPAPSPAAPSPAAQAGPVAGGRPLSEREVTILHRLSAGESNKSIARSLAITESTVKIHVKAVLRKISASNRTQAAVWALTHLKRSNEND